MTSSMPPDPNADPNDDAPDPFSCGTLRLTRIPGPPQPLPSIGDASCATPTVRPAAAKARCVRTTRTARGTPAPLRTATAERWGFRAVPRTGRKAPGRRTVAAVRYRGGMEGAMTAATDTPRLVLHWYSYWTSRWMVETHDSLNDAVSSASGLEENDAGRNHHIEVVGQDGTSRVYSGAEVVELVSAYQRSHRPTPQPHVPTPTVMVRTTVPASGESEWAEDDTIEAYRTDPEERAAQLAAILGPDRVKVERR